MVDYRIERTKLVENSQGFVDEFCGMKKFECWYPYPDDMSWIGKITSDPYVYSVQYDDGSMEDKPFKKMSIDSVRLLFNRVLKNRGTILIDYNNGMEVMIESEVKSKKKTLKCKKTNTPKVNVRKMF